MNFNIMEEIMNRESFACSIWHYGIGILVRDVLADAI